MKQFFYAIFLMGISLTARSQGVGINTADPEATLHVKGSRAMDPFMVEYRGSTKLKTFQNGGTSVGSQTIPPKDGLYVKGILQPDSGIITPKKLVIESVGKSITLKAGTNTIVMDANGDITIINNSVGTIEIQSNGKIDLSGNELNLTGNFININAAAALKIKSGVTSEISSQGTMDIKGTIIKLNGGARPVARIGDIVQLNGGSGTIATGSSTVLSN